MQAELRTEWLFDLRATVDFSKIHEIGDSGSGSRRIFPVTGGTVDGPHFHATLLPFGADFAVVRSDSVSVLDVRVIAQTVDGAEVYITYSGLTHDLPLGPLTSPADGERYFRTTPRFETASEKYSWLNRILTVGVGRFEPPSTVAYRIYAIL
ncbi:MAG: DUF3237 domain-containing protein [Dehalococcoidia bacterium]